jgi:hypothetical protein
MSTRREFARQVVGALVGVSQIPAFGQKPRVPFRYDGPVTWINLNTPPVNTSGYWKVMTQVAYKPTEVPQARMTWVKKDGKIFSKVLP